MSPDSPPKDVAVESEAFVEPQAGLAPRSIPRWAWAILGLALLFNLAVHLRLGTMPLERDEGEFAYSAVRFLHGDLPYATVYNKKLPGVSYAYALFMLVAGETAAAVKLAGTAADIVSIALLFLIAARLFGPLAGSAAALLYAVMSLAPGVLGSASHATHFVNAFALGGMLALFAAIERDRLRHWFSSGLLLGVAVMMKQHAVFLAGLVALWLFFDHVRRRQSLRAPVLFVLGLATPFGLLAIVLLAGGLMPAFWLWSVRYAAGYSSGLPPLGILLRFWTRLSGAVDGFVLLWALSAWGFGHLLTDRGIAHRSRVAFGLFLLAAFLSLLPGLLFREHYFVAFLPVVALGGGYALQRLQRFLRGRLAFPHLDLGLYLALVALLVIGLLPNWRYFFVEDPVLLSRQIYHLNPFSVSPELGRFIKSRTRPEDTIAVMGSEAQIYFYSQRKAATGFIYVYGLMDGHSYSSQMQRQMIREIETNRPKIMVVSNISTSWLPTERSDTTILTWIHRYVRENYRMVALVDIREDMSITKYLDQLDQYLPHSGNNTIYVFERSLLAVPP
ncbi:MAG: glycosyltransferase family 39 protein [Deltaproteobacteria bacterium]|nr:glycosyltransferase family 39 protein [Deltaproteobacteria bacterium]